MATGGAPLGTTAANTTPLEWRDFIKAYYPEYLRRTHCVPPVHFNRVPYQHGVVAGQPVLVSTPPVGGGAIAAADYLTDPHQPAEPETTRPRLARQPSTLLPTTTSSSASVTTSSSASVTTSSSASVTTSSSASVTTSSSASVTTSSSASVTTSSPRSLWGEPPSQTLPAVQDSDCRDDFAQQHLIHNLNHLGYTQGDVMFILSQVEFSNYLNQPCYAATASLLPTPSNLGPNKDQGDFDVLVFHRHHGVLVGEIKSVGLVGTPSDATVAKRVEKAAQQLEKSEVMVTHLLQDVAPGVTVRKALMLPYVSRSQLLRVLQNNASLEQYVRTVVGARDAAEAAELSVCSDQLSAPASPWRVEGSELAALKQWWGLMVASTQDPVMTDERYLDIIARFVGPATTVSVHCVSPTRLEVRTTGQAVAMLGATLARLVLTEKQVDVLTKKRSTDRVALVGPPGTGKTVMLGLTGTRWLGEGHDVHVLSTLGSSSLAAAQLLVHQLQTTAAYDPALRPSAGRVHLHQYDFVSREQDVQRAIADLVSASQGQQLCILVDEVLYESRNVSGPRAQRLVAGLVAAAPGVKLWTASVSHKDIPTALPHVETLTLGLRCAPAVLREVVTGVRTFPQGQLHRYTNDGLPSPADGPHVLHLHHTGQGHTGEWPHDCVQCGLDLAGVFRDLGVGANANPPSPNAPAPLEYRDVFLLTRCYLKEEIRDGSTGRVTREASGVARGLRQAGVPVCVTGPRSKPKADVTSDLLDVAVARKNEVTLTHSGCVAGLERSVVVWLHGRREGADDGLSDELVQAHDRLDAVSRCSSQLVIVHKY